jgi:short-subunit dehydrogenase
MTDLRSAYGQYTLVTGASSGTGQEFARQPAPAGLRLVPAARRRGKLRGRGG